MLNHCPWEIWQTILNVYFNNSFTHWDFAPLKYRKGYLISSHILWSKHWSMLRLKLVHVNEKSPRFLSKSKNILGTWILSVARTFCYVPVYKSHLGLAFLCLVAILGWLTNWGRVTYACVSKLAIIGSDYWSAPSNYLNQCWNIVNWTLRNKLKWNFSQNSYLENPSKISSTKWRPFCPGGDDSNLLVLGLECSGISKSMPWLPIPIGRHCTVYPKKYVHGFVVLCFVVVMQSFIK